MYDPWPRDPLSYTVLTYMPVAEEGSRGTEHAEVVQGLYDRNCCLIGCIVDRGRYEGEGVVDVNNIRSFMLHQGQELAVHLPVPDGVAKQDQRVLAYHLVVAGVKRNDLVAVGTQQIGFLGKDLILATGGLIRIVNRENLHAIKLVAYHG
jgi:hypothetical protein